MPRPLDGYIQSFDKIGCYAYPFIGACVLSEKIYMQNMKMPFPYETDIHTIEHFPQKEL